MSDNAPYSDDLPELSDEDIHLLHAICLSASTAAPQDPPFKALFAAYDRVFAEQGIEQEHDGVVFRFLLRVGEAAREGRDARGRRGEGVDLVGCLKSVLQAQGITVMEDDDSNLEDVTKSVDVDHADAISEGDGRRKQASRRRVSFNDAHLDETWLSQQSHAMRAPPQQPGRLGLLAQPARRGLPNGTGGRRARSTSSQRHRSLVSRQAAPKHFQAASPSSTAYTSDFDGRPDPTLLFQPSQTHLEQNADAFAATSSVRAARRCLHIWHDRALVHHQSQEQAYATAIVHDRRVLLSQTWDQWRTHLSARRSERALEAQRKRQLQRADNLYRVKILNRAFTHWATSTTDQQAAVRVGLTHMLRFRYFHRWRTFAVENAQKPRLILARKYVAVWRERLVRRQMRDEQAVAIFEENRVKAAWKAWFWHFCSRRVEGWREEKVKARAFSAWKQGLEALEQRRRTATEYRNAYLARDALQTLQSRLTELRQAARIAQDHRNDSLKHRIFATLTVRARLEPLARTLTLKVRLDLQRKAFKVWHLHLTLSQQAADVDRKRILQSAWTSWNDALRCKALGQKIDERVLVESLYKWVLAERSRLLRRTVDDRLARHAMSAWSQRLFEHRTRFRDAEAAFAQAKERRSLLFGMSRIHLTVRRHEDAERAAIEFASARALPTALEALTAKLRHVQQLDKWASDARFYTLCTRTLTVWKERTSQHQQNRKRDAYARVRARVKIRLVGTCLQRWRAQADQYAEMDQEARRQAESRLSAVATRCFDHWRDETARLQTLAQQATELDEQKLLASAMSSFTQRYADLAALDDRADAFRRDTELAVLAAALKKMQWAQFTAVRRAESADALWARNRDVHVRNMIRTWAAQTAVRRTARHTPAPEDEEPESPSLRPASRAAFRSAQRSTFASSPPAAGTAATPAYMRTPSRSRRAGRFRPLPTPAAVTPFTFDQSYLATTPAPLPGIAGIDQPADAGPSTLTPQVTPFARKLRAGGFGGPRTGTGDDALAGTPAPALRSSVFGRSVQVGTAKSVRFAGNSRFGSGGHLKSS